MASNSEKTPKSRSTQADQHVRNLLDRVAETHASLQDLIDDDNPIVQVNVTTAVPMDTDLRNKVRDRAEELYNATIILKEHVDPEILGGIILEAGTKRFDASVRTQLASIRRNLSVVSTGDDE